MSSREDGLVARIASLQDYQAYRDLKNWPAAELALQEAAKRQPDSPDAALALERIAVATIAPSRLRVRERALAGERAARARAARDGGHGMGAAISTAHRSAAGAGVGTGQR